MSYNYKCKYCGQEFENKYKLAGHVVRCPKNPNYERNLINCGGLNLEHKIDIQQKYQKISSITKEELQEIVNRVVTFVDILRELGYNERGGFIYKILKNKLKEFNIDTSHFLGRAHGKSRSRTHQLSEIFIQHSTYKGKLKEIIINNKIKPYKCECCGISEWMNKPITLQVHHINGDHFDNRLENLQLLCPNCHSQTENFSGANIKFQKNKK